MRLAEKYRPKSLDEVVGQDKAVAQARALIARGLAGRAVWLSGPSGSGKTTIARILAAEVADPFFIEEVVADQLDTARFDEWERSCRLSAWGKGGRAYLVNEAHGMSARIQRRFDQLLEEDLPRHCLFLFTTTWDGQDALFDGIDGGPLLSRMQRIGLTNQGLAKAGAALVQRVAQAEGLDGQPIEAYIRLMQRPEVKNNIRAALSLVESGAMLVKGGA